jgi:hypothetical protein
MPYVNPAQLGSAYFQPVVQRVLPIIPSLIAHQRAKELEGLQQVRLEAEKPRWEAQARLHNAQAAEAEQAAQMYSSLMGAEKGFNQYGITPEEVIRKKMGLSQPTQPTLKPIYKPSEMPGQPGKYVYGYPKEGEETKPENEQLAMVDYWVKGPQGWRQTSEQIPKETYNQRIKQIEAQGGQLNEPPELAVQKAVDQYRALAPWKLAQLEAAMKARGIDTSKWDQTQKLWYQTVKDRANRQIEIIKYTVIGFDEAKQKLDQVENEMFTEMQRIAVGQPPTALTPPAGQQQAPPAQAGPIPMGSKGAPAPAPSATPQQTVMPKRLPGETIEQYIQRVGNK